MDDEVKVLPNVVVLPLMVLKAFFRIFVEHGFVNSTDEADVFRVLNNPNVDVSQLSESIDNNSEDDVQQDCNNEQEEGQIVERPEVETLGVLRDGSLSW